MTDRLPKIVPDYSGLVIPPNIAPLNFYIDEEAQDYWASFGSSKSGVSFEVNSKSGEIIIPFNKWKQFLSKNIGDTIIINIYTKNQRKWQKYNTIKNYVSPDSIDSYLVYRNINTGHVLWYNMGIYMRNLSNFEETPILQNDKIDRNCLNCHSFCKNDPDKLVFHIRGSNKGTILRIGNQIKKLNTSTPYTMSAAVYPAWHPGGKLIAFSVNRIFQSFYSYSELIEVYDKASDLIVYDIEKNEITTCPQISTKGNETYPNWSPDGKYLYYCLAPQWNSNIPVDSFRYSLMRISFDEKNRSWGLPETLLDAEKLHKSVTFPRVSPDGKYVLICLSNHGVFSIFFPSSDLYLYSIATGELKKLSVNSDDVDSYHTWSSNGRWVVFSSKRMNKIHTSPFFFHIDENGNTSKPFVLPAEDPHFYETFLRNYNVPELIKRPINISTLELIKTAHEKCQNVEFDKNVNIDALSGATYIQKQKQ
ncbi:MAG TPA: hypothetical protein PLD12_11405 [Bacteroidales bacterium]|nr:hypothetical protein [Bacteroidales bacterium]HOK99737.1 hypothetical protein [Bacteroidales bacterium]HPO66510.1 hypothetical protein [Bacteroidales bacterium]